MKKILKIGNAQAFWGDSGEAPARLLQQQSDLDYITLDYLSELSLSIMAIQRDKDPQLGYAKDFLDVIKSLVPHWQQGGHVKVIANAGGLEPLRCAEQCAQILRDAGCQGMTIGAVSGDDVLPVIQKEPMRKDFEHLDTQQPVMQIVDRLMTANAYFGARPIVEALNLGADIVVTGRVADPSMTVAPCVAHFNWSWHDYNRLAQATLAGHLIECGTQVTGGIATNWIEMPDIANIGFPFVEIDDQGDFVVTKPVGTGGKVTVEAIKEQMLYEIGDPSSYLSPDVTLSLLDVQIKNQGNDRIAISGSRGRSPPSSYKVSACYRDGYRCEAMLVIYGEQAEVKAKRCWEIILERVRMAGYVLERTHIECLGCGDAVPGIPHKKQECRECVLRVSVADHRQQAVECFSRQIAPMVTSGPAGTTGYTTGRPHIRPLFCYWPCLIPADMVKPQVTLVKVV